MAETAKWTVMAYLAGDNNLSDAGEKDIAEMRAVGSTPDVNIVVEFDRIGDAHETQRYHIQAGGQSELVESLGETDCGDPRVLLDFVGWAAQRFPAERYALILWNHGSGWEPSEMERVARSAGANDFFGREASERASTPLRKLLFHPALETILGLPSPLERAICSDDGSGHSLDTIELGEVLRQTATILGQPLDLLGMDACLMSNLEVAYQVRGSVRYIVASEESEPNDGWPYDVVLSGLVGAPDRATPDLAAHIVSAYVQSYVERGYSGPVTQSALDLSRLGALTAPLDDLATVLVDGMRDAALEIWSAQRHSARFAHNTLWDIGNFCEELAKRTRHETVRPAAQGVRRALEQGPENFVIAEAHHGVSVARCTGATIYLLPPLMDISRYYADLNYAKNHRWLEMLEAYHRA
jgi:hypothetical protein